MKFSNIDCTLLSEVKESCELKFAKEDDEGHIHQRISWNLTLKLGRFENSNAMKKSREKG